MEAASEEGDKKKPPEGGEIKTKRKMKTASQLELLEKTYAVETYPSEALRAELSVKLGLTDRQLQMWFCHRRLKDRKAPPAKRQRRDAPVVPRQTLEGDDMMVEPGNEPGSGSGSGSSAFGQAEARKVVVARPSPPPPPPPSRMTAADIPMMKRYYEHPQSIMELRAIAAVESQLGEPLREDGPILGMEFDPLPPDAFGAPLAIMGQQKQAARPYDGKVYERHDARSLKTSPLLPNMEHCFVPGSSSVRRKLTAGNVHPQAAARALQEYQFLPEQPSVRSDAYDRVPSSHLYDSSDGPSARASSFPAAGPYLHGNEQVSAGYSFQGQMLGVNLLSQQGRQGHMYPSASREYDGVPHKNSFANVGIDAQFGAHPMLGLENSFVPSDRCVSHDEDVSRMDRKRKTEEAKIAREVEAHEKRIRKELEKQDLLRRKREEQMRKEMERHDRERRKEEERLMREKQKEEERFLREQRRENERREKYLQKENLRVEKMRQKEELRREKEAARLKAANERATARRIAKESMELIEDERLELMELAASTKGLASIISLDSDTLQNLHSFRDMLSTFPPNSVHLKRPFAIQPWTDSEENLGNLLMVWKFLITFADVLELWPFTLDEFIQAFHDYDPRLLGEIHVALLRCIIKDIEDVARTPSIGLGANQTSAANHGGGHPQIVEGAYAWGFDIRSWQRHLNPLTWPEILRQFALSAGFGPKLKKRSIGNAYFRDDNEGHDGEDIVCTLRNGAAAENAVAIMREKGFSHPRRSRHRLTPGTVKFAAFHVLSLEGSKGLTILEVADKIQKSGLRDLTTSKTPEASIAAALSRDTKLFERTAPSTYCVRAPFRKDPADAEAILSAARERIQIFQNGYSDSEDAEKDGVEADDVERDEDSECDVAEDLEVDDVGTSSKLIEESQCSNEAKVAKTISSCRNEKETLSNEVGETPESGFANSENDFSSFLLEKSKETNGSGAIINQSLNVIGNCSEAVILDQEETEIDESNSGEPWVEGLTEGEYSDLSVGERLDALVALIDVAVEGNSIRLVLEERLEAANALKKQMWAEAQLDKRRMKEECLTKFQYSSFMGIKAEPNATSSPAEGSQSPLPDVENKSEASLIPAIESEPLLNQQNVQSYLNNVSGERTMGGQEFSAGPDNYLHQQHVYTTEKSRFQLKASIGHKAEEMYVYRSLPLGQDRRRNRYWLFVTSASRNDPGSGRIFFESHDGRWRLIDSEEAFDALLGSLDTRGIRESHLHSMLQKIETSFRETVRKKLCKTSIMDPREASLKTESVELDSLQHSAADGTDSPSNMGCGASGDTLEQASSFKIELWRNDAERVNAYKRYLDFEKWTWKECFNPFVLCAMKYGKKRCSELLGICDVCHDTYSFEDNHCFCCHATFNTLDGYSFSEHVVQCEERQKVDPDWTFHGSDASFPMRFRLLKAMLAIIEVSIPSEAIQPFWTDAYRKSWGLKLQNLSSIEELLQMLTLLESCIKLNCLSSNFETTKELLVSCTSAENAVDYFSSFPQSVAVLPWVPKTTAAVALRLMEIDSSISYIMDQKVESQKDKEAGEFIKLPSRYTVVKNIQGVELTETTEQAEYLQEGRWVDPATACMSSGRGRGGRGRARGRSRGGRLQRGGGSSRSESAKENAGLSEKPVKGLRRKSRTRGRGRQRGRRTVRSRPRTTKRVVEKHTPLSQFETCSPRNISGGQSSRSSGGDEWDVAEIRTIKVEGAENNNDVEASESDDSAQVYRDEYDEQGQYYGNLFHGKPEDLMEESEEDLDGDEVEGERDGDDGEDGDGDEEGDGDGDGDGDADADADADADGDGDGDGDGDRDGDGDVDEWDGDDEEVDGDEECEMDGDGVGDGDGEENGDEEQEQHVYEDEDTGSASSDYSE